MLEVNDKRKYKKNGEANPDFIPEPKLIELVEASRTYDHPVPIKNFILVKQQATETMFGGNKFYIPQVAQQSPDRGVVVEVGPKVESCKKHDIVKFRVFNAEDVKVNGEIFKLIMEDDITLVEAVTFAVGTN